MTGYPEPATALPYRNPEICWGWLVIGIILGAIIGLLLPPKQKKPDQAKLEGEVGKIFGPLTANAALFNRPEFIPSLRDGETKVIQAIRDAFRP